MTKLEHFIFSPLFPSVNILFATASDESFYCTSLFTICQLEHYIFSHFHQSLHSIYVITVCCTGQFRHSYLSQQFTRVIRLNAPTVCDRLYTVYCLPDGTLYAWPFSPEPTFFSIDNCLLYCLLYWAIAAYLL